MQRPGRLLAKVHAHLRAACALLSTRAMTLGRPSLPLSSVGFILLAFTALSGCAFGDVSGTGGRDPARDPNIESSSGTASGTGGTTAPNEKPAAPEEDGPVDYDALFDAPADPTTTDGVLTGVWAGSSSYGESRLKITSKKVWIAMKCGESPANGMEVGAVVAAHSMKLLASKSAGGGASTYCGIKVSPHEIPACEGESGGYACFRVTGTTLSFHGVSLFDSYGSSNYESYTKLSD